MNMTVSSITVIEDRKQLSPLERRILKLLFHGALTRDQMVYALHVPRSTIFDALKKLMRKLHVTSYPLHDGERRRGRPRILFALLE